MRILLESGPEHGFRRLISAALPATTGSFHFYLFFILDTSLALSVFIRTMAILIIAASQGRYAPSNAPNTMRLTESAK